jgi:hypothetical protein
MTEVEWAAPGAYEMAENLALIAACCIASPS